MTHAERQQRLIELLAANKPVPYAEVCLQEILEGMLIKRDAAGDRDNIASMRSTYGVRAKLVRQNKKPIYGLDGVVRNLDNTDCKRVEIHTVVADRSVYKIFTGDHIEILFGIVAIDEDRRWNDLGEEGVIFRNFVKEWRGGD